MSKIILVGGGTASGKSTILHDVVETYGKDRISHISIDDYYKCLDHLSMEERTKVNYDHPKAFDWPLFRQQINDLKQGKTIQKPIYDFTIHNRSKETEEVKPTDIIIVEGIMALVDKEIRDLADLKLFINASRERRLVRRIIRDQEVRGRSFDSIVEQYLTTVQPMYEEIIGPSKIYADIIINNDGVQNNSVEFIIAIIDSLMKKHD